MADWNEILMTQGEEALRRHVDKAERYVPQLAVVDGEPVAQPNTFGQSQASRGAGQQAPKSFTPPVVYDASDFLKKKAPEREWLIDGWIPWRDVTLLAADGGTGKTLLSMMLGYACAYGSQWLGMDARRCKAIYYGAEDDRDELHYRMERIGSFFCVGQHHPGALRLITVCDREAELAVIAKDIVTGESKLQPTEMLAWLEVEISTHGVGLLMLDASADVFGGDEVDRKAVRTFIRMLRGICQRCNCTIVLVTHPSVDGMKSGRGYSGSTHWNNAVRSRLYMTTPPSPDGDEDEATDLREIKVMKANRGKRGQKIEIRWQDDVFVLADRIELSSKYDNMEARSVFMALLEKTSRQGVRLGINTGKNYAPSFFAAHPENKGIKSRTFEKVMHELLSEARVKLERETDVAPSRAKQVLVVAR